MYKHFEALYPQLTARLQSEVKEGQFATSALFYGPRYSLRLALVLETARVLSCHAQGDERCNCHSCNLFATFQMHHVFYFSNRDQEATLRTFADFCQKQPNSSNYRELLLKCVRLLLLRYQTLSIEERSNRPISTTLIEQLEEALAKVESAVRVETRELTHLLNAALELNSALKRSGALSVNQIRALQLYCSRSTVDGSRRFIILEGLEEASEASRNSLLKFLEEPPEGTSIFIISSKMALLNQTLLSRLRKYQVGPLEGEAVGRALTFMYQIKTERSYESLEEFFLMHSGFELKAFDSLAKQFLHASFTEEPFDSQLLSDTEDESGFTLFLRSVGMESERLFVRGEVKVEQALAINQLLRTVQQEAQIYNQSRRLALERLFYLLREAV